MRGSHKMDFDIKTFVMGSLTGLTFGLGIADLVDKDLSQFMSGMGSIVGSIGGVFAALIAFSAYKRWKLQPDYNFAHKYLNDLDNLARCFRSLVVEAHEQSFHGYDAKALVDKQERLISIKRDYIRTLRYLVTVLPSSLSLDESSNRSLKGLENEIFSLFNLLGKLHKNDDFRAFVVAKALTSDLSTTLDRITSALIKEVLGQFKN